MHQIKTPDWTRWSADGFREVCEIKRFMERWNADSKFRARLEEDPAACKAQVGLDLDPEAIRAAWDVDLRFKIHEGEIDVAELPRTVRNYREFMADKVEWRTDIREACAPEDGRWRRWRQRQIARATSELGAPWVEQIIFDTACYELSKGCSVGCWFCGVSAPRLTDHFRHTPENARLFRGILEEMVELCGPQAVRAQFLYWASDPLDNPDYEDFCHSFYDVVGEFPLFTTALAHKDLERTRRLVQLVQSRGFGVHRFSVLSLKLLEKIHAFFTPEEMGQVECVVQNNDSVLMKGNAGRFRERAKKKPELIEREISKLPEGDAAAFGDYPGSGSIACVSGFLFNLVERSVKLISPCKASDRWPLGYIVHGEGEFRTLREAKVLLRRLIDDNMPVDLEENRPLGFREDLTYRRTAEGFELTTLFGGVRVGRKGEEGYFQDLGESLAEGRWTAEEVAARLLERYGAFPDRTLKNLDWIYTQGYLSEEGALPAEDDPLVAPPPENESFVQIGAQAT